MLPSGRVLFGQMDEVVFGKPAAEAVAAQVDRLGKSHVFLMVSNSLNRKTDEIDNVRRALGNRCAGTFDEMPAHTPRAAVIEATEAARALRPTSLLPSAEDRSRTAARPSRYALPMMSAHPRQSTSCAP
jgi:hypothetical protein